MRIALALLALGLVFGFTLAVAEVAVARPAPDLCLSGSGYNCLIHTCDPGSYCCWPECAPP